LADALIGVEGLISDQLIGRHLRQQYIGTEQIVGRPRCQQERQWITKRIDQGMDFCA
jgi:hypothetical protein